MNNLRFSLPSLFGLVTAVAAGLGAWLNASVSVLTALFALAVIELAIAAHGARAGRGPTRAFCAGFAMVGSAALVVGCAYVWVAHAELSEPWIVHLRNVTRRPHGWVLRDPVATSAVICVSIALVGAFLGGAVARQRHASRQSRKHHFTEDRAQPTDAMRGPSPKRTHFHHADLGN